MTTIDANAMAHTTVTGPSMWERRVLLGATVAVVAVVAAIAGAISYGHMHDWASANGEPAWRALLFPLSVDGLLIAASVVLLADSRAERPADKLAYVLVVVASLVSVTANVAHDWVSRIAEISIAGWPPLALVGSYELLMRLLRRLQMVTEAPASEKAGAAEPDSAAVAIAAQPDKSAPRKRAASKPRPAAEDPAEPGAGGAGVVGARARRRPGAVRRRGGPRGGCRRESRAPVAEGVAGRCESRSGGEQQRGVRDQ